MRTCTIPTDLPTLASAGPGQELEIRHILHGAGPPCRRLRHGDVVVCRQTINGDVVLELRRGGYVLIPYDCAQYIQVEPAGATSLPVLSRPTIALPAVHRMAATTTSTEKARAQKERNERIKP